MEREIINHSNLLHPHVIQFKEVFLTEDYLAIAMEYAAGGDMFQLVKQRRGLPESEVNLEAIHPSLGFKLHVVCEHRQSCPCLHRFGHRASHVRVPLQG